jgi:glycine oxidase
VTQTPQVVVVGAGVIGCSVAYELARRGIQVHVIDRRDVGQGATQASAGVLAPFVENHVGSAILDLGARSLCLYDAFMSHVVEDSGLSVQYRRDGTLEIAMDSIVLARLKEIGKVYENMGVKVQHLDAKMIHKLEPQLSTSVMGGLFVDTHGLVGAADLTKALQMSAVAHGAIFDTNVPVVKISKLGDGLQVKTGIDSFSCEAVVLAAGPWSGQVEIAHDDSIPVKPIRGQLLHLEWPSKPPNRIVWTRHCYLVPWVDGSVLVGATMEDVGFDERATISGVKALIDMAHDLLPAINKAWLREVRVGLRPGTPDDLPVIGPSARLPGLFYATGHFRNGVLLAPLTASVVADYLIDDKRDPIIDFTSPLRFAEAPHCQITDT